MMRKEWWVPLVLVLLGAGPSGAQAPEAKVCATAACELAAALRALDSSDWRERSGSLRWLAKLGPAGSSAAPRVIGVLRGSPVIKEREQAAETLGWLRSPEAVPALLESLEAPSWRLQWEAATALGRLGDRQAVPRLEALAREHWFSPVRRAAAKAVESLQRPPKKGPLPAHKAQDVFAARQAAEQEQAVPSAEQCWNEKKQQWRVLKGERWLTLEPPDPNWPTKRPGSFPDIEVPAFDARFLRVDEGWLVATDGEEWGGELWLVTEDGRKTVLSKAENFLGFARTASVVVVFTGLAHLGSNEGAVHELSRAKDGTWSLRFRQELPGRPRDWHDVDGSLVVAMDEAGVVELPESGTPRMLPCP